MELRLWALRVVARRIYDRKSGRWELHFRIGVGRRVLGLDYHPTSACGRRWAWHIHIGLCRTIAFCGPRPRYYREKRPMCRERRSRGQAQGYPG